MISLNNLNQSAAGEDEDVAAERKRIESTGTNELFQTDSLIVKNLEKFYGTFLAVDRLSLGICFLNIQLELMDH